MPTGILHDIWTALASLGDHRPSKLEKVWIRFHDNHTALKDAGLLQPAVTPPNPQPLPATSPPTAQPPSTNPEPYGVKRIAFVDHLIEKPNFITLPPLRSLTVLEMDEVGYLIELSELLGRSLDTLRELRLGFSDILNIPPSAQHTSDATALFNGGVLSLLMNRIVGATDSSHTRSETIAENTSMPPAINVKPPIRETNSQSESQVAEAVLDAIDPALIAGTPSREPHEILNHDRDTASKEAKEKELNVSGHKDVRITDESKYNIVQQSPSPKGLKLEILEIERLNAFAPILLTKAIDFTMLTTLTILQCGCSSNLWGRLTKEFAPRVVRTHLNSIQKKPSDRKQSAASGPRDLEYRLRLRRIHTDVVSTNLISFLKNTLAPDSLEWLFLQDTEASPSSVTLEHIYRGPLRRHRNSLTKVMIDSAFGPPTYRLNSTARKWMLNRDVLTFITSGKMSKLRELAITLEYKDWHFFLQRLPYIPHLRSLYISNMLDHVYGSSLNIKDVAMGIIDVVALRPEVELCYLAIRDRCYEIQEVKHKENTPKSHQNPSSPNATETASDDDTEDAEHHNDDEDEDSEDDGGAGATASPPPIIDPAAMDSDTGSITSEDEEDDGGENGGKGGTAGKNAKTRLKLKDILFYDDKISVFKARHGRIQ